MKRPGLVLLAIGALVLAHELLAIALDRAELIERLLSPGLDALVAIPAALVLFGVRLALVFLAPGIALLAIASMLSAFVRARRAPTRRDRG